MVGMASAFLAGAFVYYVADASHSWNGYHWARTTPSFKVQLGDSVAANWDAHLALASSDWSASVVLDAEVVPSNTNPKNCRPQAGRVEVCSAKYGSNGWLGIASVWTSGGHITQSVVKMNDTYFSTAKYNTPAWRNVVMCQEIGHAFGLHHQDEDFSNASLGTCMDYANDPEPNQHPNFHDYEQLESIYAHLDGGTTVAVSRNTAALGENVSEWGRAIRHAKNGRESLYVKDLGRGERVYTFVVWAD